MLHSEFTRALLVEALIMKLSDEKLLITCDEGKLFLTKYVAKKPVFAKDNFLHF